MRRSYRGRSRWTPASVVTVPEADQMKILVMGLRRERRAMEGIEQPFDFPHHGGEDVRRHIAPAMTFRKRDDADRQRGPVGDVIGEPVRAVFPDLDDGDF